MFKGITTATILKNLGLAVLAFIAYLFVSMLFTSWYTRHGESTKVPKVEGMPAENAAALLDDSDLEMVIVDSVYKEDAKPMTVVEQDPKPDMNVKPGRKIYVTVNTGIIPKVKMPRLVNGGANLAKVLLQNSGLKLGRVDSVSSPIGSGLVLVQKYKGRDVAPNTPLEKGSVIDIVVSKKQSHRDTTTVVDPAVSNTDPVF
ncbi:MAG: PASTA domain-containing protein [Chitinophagaceae bacterium]